MQRVLHPQLIAYEGHVTGDEAKEQGERRVKRNLGIQRRSPGLKAFSVGNGKKRLMFAKGSKPLGDQIVVPREIDF